MTTISHLQWQPSKIQIKTATVLAASIFLLYLIDGNYPDERSLSAKASVAVLNVIKVSNDYSRGDDMKKYGNMLPESYRKHNYCELDSKDTNMQCRQVLGERLRSKPHWHFLGDSQMSTMVLALRNRFPYQITKTRGRPRLADRCALMGYLDVEKSDVWTPPDAKFLQGPEMYGLHNPFCSDMNGWGPYTIGDGTKSVEFLNVEFAQDVEIQTKNTFTTQEAVALYLKNEKKDDHVCVVNAGIHDQTLLKTPDVPKDQFVKNVQSYLKLLESVCGNLVWVGITEVQEINPERNLQRNSVSLKWNQQVYSMIVNTFPENCFIIDVWNESVAATFKGGGRQNIHYDEPYYSDFASLFAGLL